MTNGTFLSVGGNAPLAWLDSTVGNGFRGIRYLTRSSTDSSFDGDSWQEPGNQLDTARWYASVQNMPDGTLFVASGSLNGLNPTIPSNNNPTYEILSSEGVTQGESITMPLLMKAQPYYMYPFIHLLNDGTLFVFVSKNSEIFDVASGQTVKIFSELVSTSMDFNLGTRKLTVHSLVSTAHTQTQAARSYFHCLLPTIGTQTL